MKDPKIFSDCYRLAIMLFNRTKSFSKQLRPSLGRELESNCLELLILLRSALMSKPELRFKKLNEASKKLDSLKLFMQLSFDLKALSPGGYSELSELVFEIGKEMGGLLKYERGKMGVN